MNDEDILATQPANAILSEMPPAQQNQVGANTPSDDDLEIYSSDGALPIVDSRLSQPDDVFLNSGESITLEDLFLIGCARPIIFVSLVGEACSGKTTFISSLYGRIQRGIFAESCFVASKTLVAFEKITHLARISAGNSQPDTPRTSLAEGIKFFHLELMNVQTKQKTIFVFSDRAGEFYNQFRNSPCTYEKLPEIQYADWVVLLMDGGKVADQFERHNAMQSTRQLLQALLDNGSLGSASRVQLVLTKHDILDKLQKENISITEHLEEFHSKLHAEFSGRLEELTFFQVSARDPTGKLATAHRVEEMLTAWFTPGSSYITPELAELNFNNQFDQLLLRTYMEGHNE